MTSAGRFLHGFSGGCDPIPEPTDRSIFPILLAGGRGSRLHELTDLRCKPAVPFVAGRRIVDFTMANLADSGLTDVLVATQYRAETLEDYLRQTWQHRLAPGGLRLRDPARNRGGPTAYDGTADAVRGNIAEIDTADPDEVLIVAGDHIYKMDYRPMIEAHRRSSALVTVAVDMVPRAEATAFGVLETDASGRVTRFAEKPADPPGSAVDPSRALVSMGIYVIDWTWLKAVLSACPEARDFGRDVLPMAVFEGLAHVFVPGGPGEFYWRDVGTLDALRRAALDFSGAQRPFALPAVPRPDAAPIRDGPRLAHVVNIQRSLVMDDAVVSLGALLSDTIVAPGCVLPFGTVIGLDRNADAQWYRRTKDGTVLVTPEMIGTAPYAQAHRPAGTLAKPFRKGGTAEREPIA